MERGKVVGLSLSGRIFPFCWTDSVTYYTNVRTTQSHIIAAVTILIEQRAKDVVGPRSVSQTVEEIDGDAVVPIAKRQQMVVRLRANQLHRLFTFADHPRLAIVFIHKIFRAGIIFLYVELHLIVWISLAGLFHSLSQQIPVNGIPHLQCHADCPTHLFSCPCQVKSL